MALRAIQQGCLVLLALVTLTDGVADILLVRMTSDSLKPPEQRYGYRNALAGLSSLMREEGVKSLCRGLGTNSVRLFSCKVTYLQRI